MFGLSWADTYVLFVLVAIYVYGIVLIGIGIGQQNDDY
jgi:hypothetical protein